MDDVELTELERQCQVRARSDRDADAAAPRDRHGRPERDDLGLEPVEERAPARRQLFRPVRGREDRDGVPKRTQLLRDTGHMLVDVVRLRPGERRHQANAHRA